MRVVKISKEICNIFVKEKHYSRKLGIFWEGFALVEGEENKITGIVVYGQPSPPIQRFAFTDRNFRLYELSRLVIQSKTKNAASFLISNSIKLLSEKPCAIVSYSDTEYGHCGIVYQACNFIYTGSTKSHDCMYIVGGVKTHPMTLRDMGITNPTNWAKENNIEKIKPKEKHRYFFIAGNKYEKKKILSKLNYAIIKTYPKSDKSYYDDGKLVEIYYDEK